MSTTAQQSRPQMTRQEYLEFEEASEVRHEFYRGELFAMTGGTDAHSRLKVRLVGTLDAQTRDGACQVYDADMRVLIAATGLYTYPDASVACGDPKFDTDRRNTLLNPLAVFEVLSRSTETYDRGRKFEHYLTIPSLRHYVLIAQAKPRIEAYTRDDAGNWRLAFAQQPGDVVVLEFIGCRLAVDELYDGIELQPEEQYDVPRSVDPDSD